jgi:hypothetical protein
VHDIVALESRGVPTAALRTTPFAEEEAAQAAALGLRGWTMIELPHPVQPVPAARIAALADTVLEAVVSRLTEGGGPGVA